MNYQKNYQQIIHQHQDLFAYLNLQPDFSFHVTTLIPAYFDQAKGTQHQQQNIEHTKLKQLNEMLISAGLLIKSYHDPYNNYLQIHGFAQPNKIKYEKGLIKLRNTFDICTIYHYLFACLQMMVSDLSAIEATHMTPYGIKKFGIHYGKIQEIMDDQIKEGIDHLAGDQHLQAYCDLIKALKHNFEILTNKIMYKNYE